MTSTTHTNLQELELCELAGIIARDWPEPFFGAVPYLRAMRCLSSVDEHYGQDSGRMIVVYFLSNARTWKGETARAVKAELKRRSA